MDWENRLKELNGYNISFEIKQGYYHVALVYEDTWNILAPENENIYLEERNGFYHYIGSIDSIKIEDIFKAIDATIEYNMDLQKKLILFRQKTEELQEIFTNEDYETLQTIEFKFTKKEDAKKLKTKAKTKEKTAKKTKTKPKKKEKVEEIKPIETQDIKQEINSVSSVDYDENDDIVTMNGGYMEELER